MRIFQKARSVRGSIFSVLCAIHCFGVPSVYGADQADPGTTAPSTTTGQRPVLHTGVVEKEQMQPSVKLLLTPPPVPTPSAAVAPAPRPTQSTVNQFAGSSSYTPGNQAPMPVVPHKSDAATQSTPAAPFVPKYLAPPLPQHPANWNYTATPSNGVMNWAPGYGTSVVRPPKRISSMETNLKWSSSSPGLLIRPSLLGLDVRPKLIQPPPPGPSQLKAVQKTLPEAQVAPPANWEDWYQRVAKAIYEQWRQQTQIGPGTATVLITVFKTHDVDCKISNFSPVGDAKRDPVEESRFRDASLRSVTSLNGTSVWQFPIAVASPKKIAFDMEFKHEVGGVPGCQVVHMHDNKSMSSLQDR